MTVVAPLASAPLRAGTAAADGLVVLAALLSGVAPRAVCAGLLVVLLLGQVPPVAARLAPVARRVAPLLLIAALLLVWRLLGDGAGSSAALAVLACVTVVGHHLSVRTHRDVVVSVLATGGATVLVLSQDGSWLARPAVAGAWVAAVVALALRVSEGREPADVRTAARTGTWRQPLRRTLWPLVASVVAVLVLALLGVQPPSGGGGRSGGEDVSDAVGGFGGSGSATGAAWSRSPSTYSLGVVDLRSRGDLPRTPVARVPSSSDRLWRAQVLGGYDGLLWYAVPLGPVDGDPVGLGDRDPAATAGTLRTDHVELLADLGDVALVPGHATDVRPRDGGWVGTGYGQSVGTSSRDYQVDSFAVPAATDAGPAAGAGPLPGDPDGDLWTTLPPATTARTYDLAAELTRGARSRAEAVAAVEAYLGGFTYDLDAPLPADGQEAVDHFLFDSRTGWCEHFAAAEVVLLRAVGIPARMATGFSGGEDQGDGTRLVRGDRAHAWVEVWQPGTGWAPSDPTPAADGAGTQTGSALGRALDDRDLRVLLAVLLVVGFLVAAAVAVAVSVRRGRRAQVAVAAPA
ncbi:transglutaminase-like domain-containing protein, partial [Angustibacter speluncae]